MAKRRSEADRRSRQVQRLGRALQVLRLIQERHGRWDLSPLARELGCSTKTVQRDLLALEEAQIPFFYDKRRCCYAIHPGFRLSILDQPDAGAIGDDNADSPAPPTPQPTNPIEIAEASRDQAERFLAEAERLIESLEQLCQSLRGPNPSGPGKPTGGLIRDEQDRVWLWLGVAPVAVSGLPPT